MKRKCPNCGTPNNDNWPLRVKGRIIDGGCQECWEEECDRSWWEMMGRVMELLELEEESETA